MKLTIKFNLILFIVLLLGLASTGVFSYRILQQNARNEIVERAGMMMEAALAMRGYTVGEIRPLLALQMKQTFLPQTVPAYAATQTFNKLRESHAEYTYKEATLNPTNPRDRALDWEADLVEEFRNHPDRDEIVGNRETPTGQSLYLARPIKIKNEACLTCHSTVDVAPATMVERYGPANGFGWKHNEIVGAQIVSVPMSVPIEHARRAFIAFLGSLVAVFAAIIIVLNIMLRLVVIRPITRMANLADDVSRGQMDVPEFDETSKDEVGTLASSFNRMRRSLEKAMKMLGE